MSNSDLLAYIVIAAVPTVLVCAYATYWAFIIRHSLVVRLYRNQALGVGMVALSVLLVVTLVTAIIYVTGQLNPGQIASPLVFFLFILIFYWIDSSVLAARRSDPRLRDTLHWRRLRIVLWGVLIFAVSFILILLAFPEATGSVPTPGQSVLLLPLFLTTIYLPSIAGIVVIPVAARRSGDITFRRHLKWFGGFAASLVLFLAGSMLVGGGPPSSTFLGQVTIEIGFTLGGYALYRSAKALVPLNRISLSD